MQQNFQPPVPVDPHHLVASARLSLAATPPNSPEYRATAHRAVSTAYYAAFHALNANNAGAIIGTPTTQTMADDWIRIYRSTRHRHAATRLDRNQLPLSNGARIFSRSFSRLYNARIRVDYRPQTHFDGNAAHYWLDRAEVAIQELQQLNYNERATIAAIMT